MASAGDRAHSLTDLMDLIEARDRAGFISAIGTIAADDGVGQAIEALATVQVETGRRWQHNEWTVADEHAASAMVDLALTASTQHTGEIGGLAAQRPVVVACVESEWHVLPARMLSEQLRLHGCATVFLGASMPPADLATFAASIDPVAVILSCSMTIHLAGAKRTIDACRDAGLPVVVGGSAFGGAEHRASAVGADASVGDVDELLELLARWRAAPPASPTEPDSDSPSAPETLSSVRRGELIEHARRDILRRVPPLEAAGRGVQSDLADHLEGLIDAADAAVLSDDPLIVADFSSWLVDVTTRSELPGGIVPLMISALRRACEAHDDLARYTLMLDDSLASERG